MKIAVTGATGRVGRRVVALAAAAGHDVTAVDMAVDSLLTVPRGRFEVRRADVADLGATVAALEGAEVAIHLAAIVHPMWDSAPMVYVRNTEMTMNVFEAARLLGISRVVQASSESTLGFSFAHRPHGPDWYPINENHPSRPQDSYGLSKLAAEEIAQAYWRRARIDSVSLRFCRIIFTNDWESVLTPIRRDPALGARMLWSYIAVEDAAAALLAAIRSEVAGCHAVFATAQDSYMGEPTAQLMAAHYPSAQLRGPIANPHFAVISADRAKSLLDWRARVSWRDHLD